MTKLSDNLRGVPCGDVRLEPIHWAVLIYEEEKYKKHRVKAYNKKTKEKAPSTARAAKRDATVRDALTIDHQTVKDIWEDKLITESSPEA